MKIEYIHGDLLKTEHTHILHGCNSQGVMGSGVAKLIRAKWPKAYNDYLEVYNSYGLELGSMVNSTQPDGKIIINAITQNTFGKTGVHVSYWAIATVFKNLNLKEDVETVAMPTIGAGLGGGKWSVIEAIIEQEAKTYQPIVYLYD